MQNLDTLREFLRSARRRAVMSILFDQAVVATGIALGGAVVLLILGTQILDWYWPLLLAAAGFAAGLYRALRRIPSDYQLAQQVDRQLALNDCLSSGWYFASPDGSDRGSGELRELVSDRAAQLCGTISPEAAVPMRSPRYLARTAAVALVACTMFGVRYGLRGSLDLRPPIVESVIGFVRTPREVAEARKATAKRPPDLPPQAGVAVDPETAQPIQQSSIDENAYSPQDPLQAERRDIPAQAEEAAGSEGEEESGGERASAGDGKAGNGEDRDGDKGKENAKSDQKDADQPGADSSLLDKMRDAFQNMLAKLKIDAKTTESAKAASKAGKQGGGRKQGGEKGDSAQNRSAGQGKARPDQQGDQMAQGGENAEIAKGQSAERNPEHKPADGEKSGIGKSDGAKDLRDAEQLAAMGKLSELFGKRQANLTGEVLVEVSSSRQQGLKTPYSDRTAKHAEGGGEIHRDEIPLIYQQYVQQYFEQVRKQAPAAEPARK